MLYVIMLYVIMLFVIMLYVIMLYRTVNTKKYDNLLNKSKVIC